MSDFEAPEAQINETELPLSVQLEALLFVAAEPVPTAALGLLYPCDGAPMLHQVMMHNKAWKDVPIYSCDPPYSSDERAVAYLQVDASLTLIGAGGHLDNYGLASVRLGEPAVEQAFFLEGLLPLVESPYFVPSIELDCGRAADLHLHQDGDTTWVVLFDVTEQRDDVATHPARDLDVRQQTHDGPHASPGTQTHP